MHTVAHRSSIRRIIYASYNTRASENEKACKEKMKQSSCRCARVTGVVVRLIASDRGRRFAYVIHSTGSIVRKKKKKEKKRKKRTETEREEERDRGGGRAKEKGDGVREKEGERGEKVEN